MHERERERRHRDHVQSRLRAPLRVARAGLNNSKGNESWPLSHAEALSSSLVAVRKESRERIPVGALAPRRRDETS